MALDDVREARARVRALYARAVADRELAAGVVARLEAQRAEAAERLGEGGADPGLLGELDDRLALEREKLTLADARVAEIATSLEELAEAEKQAGDPRVVAASTLDHERHAAAARTLDDVRRHIGALEVEASLGARDEPLAPPLPSRPEPEDPKVVLERLKAAKKGEPPPSGRSGGKKRTL